MKKISSPSIDPLCCTLLPPSPSSRHLLVSVPEQKMRLFQGKRILATYSISTSKFGLGYQEGSFQTPLGHFYIHAKIGEGAALREIFRNRQPTGVIATLEGEGDLITTRILWLGGLERKNANTQNRYIYIHGTNHESLLGQPASHGCIRMSNIEIKRLFKRINTNDLVSILNTPFKRASISKNTRYN